MGAELREGARKRRVLPASGKPRRVVNEAKRAQRFDQPQCGAIEIAHLFVTDQKHLEASPGLVVTPRDEKPEVLDRGPAQHVVEIQEERPLLVPKQVAQM